MNGVVPISSPCPGVPGSGGGTLRRCRSLDTLIPLPMPALLLTHSPPPTAAGLLGGGIHHLPPVKARWEVRALHPAVVPHVEVPGRAETGGR